MPRPVVDISGARYSRLKVIKLHEKVKDRGARWLCKCDCGTETISWAWELKNGKKKSCGCFNKEIVKQQKTRLSHGLSKTRFYRIWFAMKRRCTESKNELFKKYYIDRGITVCEEWLTFENFKRDMYSCYLEHIEKHSEKNTSIDRINNDLGYTKENCRWATNEVQNQNRRNREGN
ncbi:hypothetical protein FZC79_10255 [Rossellomorea vietnamensis]|uniref:Uncharacterized protein n=1 Tax=Rossellomorea vietnamensis TaxID=218284 RepID=A0A5D4KE00_9BACI|nr:hypothetical protein [Rossellomorea vietnamensis]TYR75544.1 hypothetical protein FZC79_10255 [Rossellomorea vietnamensis]